MISLGVDGCRTGWLCVSNTDGTLAAKILPTFDAVLATEASFIAIDVPIGLPSRGSRACDIEARQLLRAPRASSVFPAPVRACLDAETFTDACDLHFRTDGRRLSKQAHAIVPKIREVDRRMSKTPSLQQRVREIHPELCFAVWNDGVAMGESKKKVTGRTERFGLVEAHWPGAVRRLAGSLPRGAWQGDDLLDALAALWTANRIANGVAIKLPKTTEYDDFGLRMEMLA